ncbi:hypothetical protein BC939DRAFT_178457 [Gamsiella multidivaricata]|uniref:uncharacterized protein n=1 Tax=Gamsiella multidivaricata TaxID=101098 RepID=UPI00221E69EB|nr:uncharacterized protein BC939DRAFT_178457 [Gamsiella multidivaricata]KAG0366792.1 hypothetical protein BGZ54_004869 [Gamsiella multidivaricata]KAI7822505.1 hypothetical protein BC939DRAFT_178457 [Gamsiella multidivaricata]
MATMWSQDRTSIGSRGSDARTGSPAAAEASPVPPLLDQHLRLLLSPVPASMAQDSSKSAAASSLSSSSSPTTVTLYPVEAVPSHLLCAICTLPYENPVHFLPCCHVFCLECIQLWIGMNFGDDLLQSELRRAYPAEGDVVPGDELGALAGYDDMLQQQPLQQQFMFELARMGGSRSRTETSNSNRNFYESFNHFSPAQQQLLQQQQTQQRIAVLLESREMPKCPMCRTGLHINGWDRIEEQIKVPVTISPRPRPSSNTTGTAPPSSSSDWLRRGNTAQGQRPVSGVERRRVRPDRFAPNGLSRRREEAIGEEEEGEDEEIEMEHVRTVRGRFTNVNTLSPHSSLSSSTSSLYGARNDRTQPLVQPTVQADGRSLRQTVLTGNDDEELQSPTTAVIGRRPSEWMRYQQRQVQAHQERQQANRLQTNATSAPSISQFDRLSGQSEAPHSYAIADDRYNEQQQQIRRLYLEQESQEELLRSLTARAASILEEEEESRRHGSDSGSSVFASNVEGITDQPSSEQLATQLNRPGGQDERSSGSSEDTESGVQRTQSRQSLLQIDTSLTRPSVQSNQSSSTHSRQLSRGNTHPQARETEQDARVRRTSVDHYSDHHPESPSSCTDEAANDSDDNDSIINAIQQGTRAWAQRPSSLGLGLGENQRSMPLSLDDAEGNTSISDSVSDSNQSPSAQHSPELPTSPSNGSTLSYGTSSTSSPSIQNNSSIGTSFSQRSSSQPQWERHSLSLQMPVMEAGHTGFGVSDSVPTTASVTMNEREDYTEQPWRDHNVETDDREVSHKSSIDGLCAGTFGTSDVVSSSSSMLQKGSDTAEEGGLEVDSTETVATQDATLQTGSIQGSSSGAALGANLVTSPGSSHKPCSSPISPLLRDLHIHSPVATAQGPMTTIADMHIDPEVLARARSCSVTLTEDDLPSSARGHPSPIDSPIPTPSTARPRHRFPAGIRLAGEEGEQTEEEQTEEEQTEEEQTEEEQTEEEELADTSDVDGAHLNPEQDSPIGNARVPAEGEHLENEGNTPPALHAESHGTGSSAEVAGEDLLATNLPAEDTSVPFTAAMSQENSAVAIQDPLSAAISNPEETLTAPESTGTMDSDRADTHLMTPLVRPFRENMSSPPPLPLPLPVAVEERDIGSTLHSESSNVAILTATTERVDQNVQPIGVGDSRRTSITGGLDVEPTSSPAPFSAPFSLGMSSSPLDHPEEDEALTSGVQEHVQYRTLVRYQPRLPKAHVMSDLISQIRVECPHKDAGCTGIMEMQKALQHGRDQCHFRMVMCPRPRCGLWMRADQIVEHVLMVESGSNSAGTTSLSPSASSSSSSPSTSGPSPTSSVSSARSTGRGAGLGLQQRQSSRSQHRSLRDQRNQSGLNGAPKAPSQAQQLRQFSYNETASTSPNPSILPCAGLTWEREQLTRATGIIGQLTEENTSLRQMIRQLTQQNAKLIKDKDLWQRYTNISLRRD